MIQRIFKNLGVLHTPVPDESTQLEREGFTIVRGVFGADEIAQLRKEVDEVFDAYPPERLRDDKAEFRYEMLNRSAACQAAVVRSEILAVIEPLLGGDCHVIANTAWRNPADFGGGPWHCDAGPHIPRDEGVPWPDDIAYPVFAIGAHILLQDCALADGPTAVVPASHRSGRLAPFDRMEDPALSYDGRPPALLEGEAGDVSMFVSDVWHRGTASGEGGRGRYFLQVHYGRRDIAQRIRPPHAVHQLSDEAMARAGTEREKSIAGLHDPFFYDS